MHNRIVTTSLLATALAGAIALTASAQTGGNAAKEKELEAARAELQAAARRVAELSRELGRPGEGAYVFEHRMLQKPALGVLLDADDGRGVRISGVTPDSGAAKAGLRAGDRITSVDGKAVAGANGEARLADLRARLANIKESQPVQVGYERDGRASTVSVSPQRTASLTMLAPDGSRLTPHGAVRVLPGADGALKIESDSVDIAPPPGMPLRMERQDGDRRIVQRITMRPGADGPEGETRRVRVMRVPGVAPEVRQEVIRLTRDPDCNDKPECHAVALAEAFRWNGLNLASVDAQLGRYFGTSDGVLVVSAAPDLAGLQPGDVIRKVDGRAVAMPRDVMDVLRAKPDGTEVAIEYLRDRKVGAARVKVPKAMRIPLPPPPPVPPAPPADAPMPPPPAPPPAGVSSPVAPPAPPIAAVAPPPPRID